MAESKLRTISIDFAGNGACFYQSPFLSGKFTLKILTLQTYLLGGRSENADHFFNSRQKFCEVFSCDFCSCLQFSSHNLILQIMAQYSTQKTVLPT